MAKKKLNKQVAAAVACTVIVLGGGGVLAYKLYEGTYRPAQLKKEGRELMLKGDYAGADKDFRRAAGHGGMATDVEFLGWMYETTLHRTSVSDAALRDAHNLLEQTLATRPGDVPTIIRKLKFDLDLLDGGGVEQFGPEQASRMIDLSAKVLATDPANAVAIRADAMAHGLPLFKQDTSQTSADIDAILNDFRKRLEANPDNPDLVTLYTIGMGRMRETLLREHAIQPDPSDPRVKAMYADVNARLESMLKSLADEKKPAEERALGYARAARIDQIIASSGFIPDKDATGVLMDRRSKSLAMSAKLVPVTSDLYAGIRIEQANALAQQEKMADAEALLRETIAAAPSSWQPRLFLADLLSERGRAAEALELVSADLQPGNDLVGLAGYQFLNDQKQVPLRRAFYRLQNLGNVKPEDKDKEQALAQTDYDSALANSKVSDTDPYALQIQAIFLELKQDRTGAAQMLTRALDTAGGNERLKLRLEQQLVSLNLALNQPGAASAMLEQMVRNPTLTPQTQVNAVIQLIDLRIRNGATEQARLLLDQAKKVLPGNPALLALEIKMMTDPDKKREYLKRLPEETQPQRFFKIKFASELEDEATLRRLTSDALKAEPGSLDVSMILGDYLRRHGHSDEAVAVFQAAQKAHPDNKTLDLLIKDTTAVSPEERGRIATDMLTDPYRRALFEADQARMKDNVAEYYKKLLEAEPLDKDGEGTATERLALYYMTTGEPEKSMASIDRLAKMHRDPAQIRLLRVRLALAQSKVPDAMAQADSLTTDLPNFAPGWIVKGQAFQLMNQPSQAIDAYETALVQQPGSIEALHGLVESADSAGRRDVVKRYLDEGIRVTNGSDDFFVDGLLRYEVSYGDPTTTIDARIKRRDAAPDDRATWVALAQTYMASASNKERDGDKPAAKDFRAKALATYTQAAAKFPNVPGFTLEGAKLVAAGGDVDGAIKMVDGLDSVGNLSDDMQIQRARFYAVSGHPEAAVKLLQGVVAAGKPSDAIRTQLSSIQAGTGDTEGALHTLEGVADSAAVREMRMNLFIDAKRLPEAQKLVDDALAKERSVPNLLMAGVVQAREDHTAAALKLTDEAIAADPENPAARFTRVRIMLSERPLRNNDMIADLGVVKKNAPTNIEARLLLVERLRALSRTPEATQELESLQRDFPGELRVVTQLVQAYSAEVPPRYARIDQLLAEAEKKDGGADAQLLSLKASIALRRGDTKAAVAAATKARDSAPQDMGVERTLLATLLRAGGFNEAIAEVDRVQKDNTSIYWTYLTRGVALHRLKRDPDAAKEFDRAIGLAQAMKESADTVFDVGSSYSQEYGGEAASAWVATKLPDDATTKVLQMRLLTAAGKTDQSIVVGEQLIANLDALPKPTQIQVLSTMGNAYLMASPPKSDNAQTVFARLNEIEPDNMMTLNNLAYAMTLGNTGPSMQEAVAYAQKAYDLAEKNATPNAYITDTYGWTLFKSGKADEGLVKLQEAFEIGNLAETQWHMGEIYLFQAKTTDDDAQKKLLLATAQQTLNAALAKLNLAKQNGEPVDTTLVAHVENALKQAQ